MIDLGAGRECAAPWEREPHRAWSLWDMIKQEIWKFIRAGMNMKDFQFALDLLEKSDSVSAGIAPVFHETRIEDLDETKKVEFRKFVCELRGLSKDLGLTVSHMLLLLAESDLPKTGQVFGQILIAMRRELHDKLFLYVPAERASYWEWDDVLSEKAGAAFSGPYSELREAANFTPPKDILVVFSIL